MCIYITQVQLVTAINEEVVNDAGCVRLYALLGINL
jgi:hypothetical protein